MTPALLPLLIAVPLLLAGILIVLPGILSLKRVALVTSLVAGVAVSAVLLAQTANGEVMAEAVAGWAPGVAIVFAVDTFSALMLLVTMFLTLVSVWFAIVTRLDHLRFFAPLVLVLTAGVNGALMTADLFNLFVFVEVMLLPSYALMMLAQPGRGRVATVSASRIYVTVNLLTSTVLLAGIGLVYGLTGTVNMAQLAGAASADPAVAVAVGIVLLSFAIKASVVPVHGWISRTYPFMSPAVNVMFSALHTKVAAYAIYRIYAVVFDGDARYLWIGVLLFSLSMLIGVFGAVGEKDPRSILSFHMVSQLGYILLGAAMFTQFGLTAGIFYLIHNMIVKAGLFLSVSAVEEAYGRHPLGAVTGLLYRDRPTAVVFLICALSMAGIPPLSGFVAKLTIVVAAWEAGQIVALVAAILASLFTALSMMKIWGAMFLGDPDDIDPALAETVGTRERRVPLALIAPAGTLAALSILLGVGAQLLLPLTGVAADGLLDPSAYVEAVLSS